MSQTRTVDSNPLQPTLQPAVRNLVEKAQQSAILALDVYNRPATVFRSEAFIVLMTIAWTALFQAIFEQRRIPYYYKDDRGDTKFLDGQEKAWDIRKCMKEFYGTANPPARKNLHFLIGLRDKIEHRFSPQIDPSVAGECQAMLLNFDELLVERFGKHYALQECLCVPLLTSSVRPSYQMDALKRFQANQYEELRKYIDGYRDGLEPDIREDPRYCLRVYLDPKLGNRAPTSDVVLGFVKESELTGTEQVVAVKERLVPAANPGRLKPDQVAKAVEKRLGRPFTRNNHTGAWKYYQVRVSANDAAKCKTEYCQYDEAHASYVYTTDWVEFLVFKLSDQEEYDKVVDFPWWKPTK